MLQRAVNMPSFIRCDRNMVAGGEMGRLGDDSSHSSPKIRLPIGENTLNIC
jgi:hypothetical protein